MYLNHFLKLLIFILLLSSCKRKKEVDYTKIKSTHEARMNFIKAMPDPYIKRIPDSMKLWIPFFREVYRDDQKFRIIGYVMTEEEITKQKVLDSINLMKVMFYLNKYGWPNRYDIGFFGTRAVAMVIQHAPLKTQEKYYPSLIEAFKKDSLLFETVALLEDRINMRNRRRQFYGSQIVVYKNKYVLYPLTSIDSIENFRRRIGFKMPLNDYLKMLNVEWNIPDYKKLIFQIEKEFKVSDTLGIHYLHKF